MSRVPRLCQCLVDIRVALGMESRFTGHMLFDPIAPVDATVHERTLRLALNLSIRVLPEYGTRTSKKDFTQRQLMAIALLRAAFNLSYRAVVQDLSRSPALVECLNLKRVPHFTTIESFVNTPGMEAALQSILSELLKRIPPTPADSASAPAALEVAIDSTGVSATHTSIYFDQKKRGSAKAPYRAYVKLSVAVVCGVMLPCAMIVDWGPSADLRQAEPLIRQMVTRVRPATLYADAGYDAERLHELCRDELGIESFIPPVARTRDGTVRTRYRARMTRLPKAYGRRWHVESFMSALKRTTGSSLRARGRHRPLTELSFRVVAYAIRRVRTTAKRKGVYKALTQPWHAEGSIQPNFIIVYTPPRHEALPPAV
jgi:Transposase DDE domain